MALTSQSVQNDRADTADPRLMMRTWEGLDSAVAYSVVIPVYRSAAILPGLYRRLTQVMHGLGESYEIVFVEDCGPDDAWFVLQELTAEDSAVTAIQLMHNSGQSNATLCGMAHARGAMVITMDDDLQHPPEEIPALIEALGADVDVVMGVPREKKHSWFRRVGSNAVHRITCYLLGKDRNLRFTSFRLMRRAVVDGLLTLRTLSPALGPMIYSVTRRIVNTPVQHAPRSEGKSGYTFGRLLSQIMSNLIGYSMLPLRLLAIVGCVGILLSTAFAAVLLTRYLTGGITLPGWTTLALLLVVLSGFNFFAFAILGEYVLRILQRVNATPQYLVRTHLSSMKKR
jgi:dolichol-phosphate mannosyltransferase/undecaprenyl-phosphate 4-deoxy-4-formamido-L-arabinose transferase